MLGKPRLRQLVGLFREGMGDSLGSLSLQTNAVLVDAEWAAFSAT